ncbi:MAG: HAD hydrolase-like protein [Magnetococcus sp. DMHC-8]
MKPLIHDRRELDAHHDRYRALLCRGDGRLDDRLRAGRMERVSFATLRRGYDLLLLDAFGVLYRDRTAIAGAAAAVARLYREGVAWLVLSNNASQSPAHLTARLGAMGLAVRQEEILTSGMAVRPFVAASPWYGLPYCLVGPAEAEAAYAPEPERLCVNHGALETARYLLLCSNRDYYGSPWQRQVEGLLAERRLPIVLANPDLVTPDGAGGLTVVAGYTAVEWVARFGCAWVGVGKPFSPLYALVRQRFPGVAPDRVLMVGDSLDTDILGGAAQGFATCLTLSGLHAADGDGVEALCRRRGICPDFVVQSIAT